MTDWKTRRDEWVKEESSRYFDMFHQVAKQVAYHSFEAGRNDTLERIQPLIKALEFYANPNRHPPAVRMFTTREEFEKEYNIAREALAKWRKEME